MWTIKELTREQLLIAKQIMMWDMCEADGMVPTARELAAADSYYSDESAFEWFEDTLFSPEDFE